MNGLRFYALSNAWLLALVVPVVLFYFLKLKRPQVLVPSLVLWRRLLDDRRVNSPFQRFKRNLLLLLQLLALCALIAAAMQPFRSGRRERIHQIPVLLDASASMGALDAPGGRTRLEEAKSQIREIIDGLLPDQEMCLIVFGRTARKVADFTNNKRVLLGALDAVRVDDVAGDVEDALRMVQALAQRMPLREVVLFSDGNFPVRAHFDLSFKLRFEKLPPGGPNLGITFLNARRSADGPWDVFAMIERSAQGEDGATVELLDGRESLGVQDVDPKPDDGERLVFRVPGDRPASLELKLTPRGFDALDSDNVAFLRLPVSRPVQAQVAPEMAAFRHALSVLDSVSLVASEEAPAGTVDLLVSDDAADLNVDAGTCLFVGVRPPDLEGLIEMGTGGTSVVDWRRGAQLLHHVELDDLAVLDQPCALGGAVESDFEARGYEVLIHGEDGPLLLQKREGERLLFFLLFHTDRSTLPYRLAFPVLVSNLVQVAMEQAGLAGVSAARTGVITDLTARPGETCTVRGPGGEERSLTADAQGLLSGLAADRVGYYTVSRSGGKPERIGAALLSPQETGLRASDEIRFDEDLSVAASTGGPETDRRLWPLLAMGALGLLMCEWWYFQRRPGGFAR